MTKYRSILVFFFRYRINKSINKRSLLHVGLSMCVSLVPLVCYKFNNIILKSEQNKNDNKTDFKAHFYIYSA